MKSVLIILTAFGLFEGGLYMGQQRGLKAAYDTRNVSDGLEMACLSLWVGEQNRKYWEKENKK